MLTPEAIFRAAKDRERRIGIGSRPGSEVVETSVKLADASGYGRSIIFEDPQELTRALKNGEIEAAVRGDLDSKASMEAVKKTFGLTKVMRLALIQPRGEGVFFLAPVGVDEGGSIEEKFDLARRGATFLARMGVEARIGVMSGGRSTDRGRSAMVDRSIDEAEAVVGKLRSIGLDAEDVQILIEEAVRTKTLIIAPDGISGNLIFRCIHLVDGGRSMGAPILNLDAVYIDTTRAKTSYVDSIALASALCGGPVKRAQGHPGNIKR